MLNQCILVGKLTEVKTVTVDDVAVVSIKVSIKPLSSGSGSHKNNDVIECQLSSGLMSALEYLHEGATVGVKARLSSSDGSSIKVLAEKITFINTPSDDEESN